MFKCMYGGGCIFKCVYTCMFMHMEARDQSFLGCHSPVCFETVPVTGLKLTTGWPASSMCPSVSPPSAGLEACATWLFMWLLEVDLRSLISPAFQFSNFKQTFRTVQPSLL